MEKRGAEENGIDGFARKDTGIGKKLRQIFVIVGKEITDRISMENVIPEGNVIPLLLFHVLTNDLPKTKCDQFAQDKTV